MRQPGPQDFSAPCPLELGLLLLPAGLDGRLAVAQPRDLAAKLCRAGRRNAGSCWRALAASRLRVFELGLLLVQLRLKVRAGAPPAASTAAIAATAASAASARRRSMVDSAWALLIIPQLPTGLADGLARRIALGRWPGWPLAFRPGDLVPPLRSLRHGWIRQSARARVSTARPFCKQSLTVVMPAASGFSPFTDFSARRPGSVST